MAKRARGANRPGQRAPLRRSSAARSPLTAPRDVPPPATPVANTLSTAQPANLTDEEEARADEIEARLVAAERSAEEAARRQTRGRRPVEGNTPVRAGTLAVRASEEYAYVARDVRRIALIGGSLIGLLLGLWVVTQATGLTI
jgi:hypothetical protein